MKKICIIFFCLAFMLVACNNQTDEARYEANRYEGGGQLSSDFTTESSEEFPHTAPVQIQHSKYDYTVQDSFEINRNEIEKLLPKEVLQKLPQNLRHITIDDLHRLIPEGATQLTPEQVMERIQRGKRHHQKPTQPIRPEQGGGGRPAQPTQPDQGAGEQPTQPTQPDQGAGEQPTQPTQPDQGAGEQPTQPTQPDQGAGEQPTQPTQPDQGAGEQPETPDAGEGQPPQQETEQPEQEETPQQTEGISEIEQQVIDLTNQERRNQGLPDLQADSSLSNVAREKSRDMQQNNYFSHTSPTYGSPFDMMRDFGISYNSAGENIAQGQRSPEEVVQAWMNSQGHRENIMNPGYTHIGVGYVEQGNYWTQMFISR